MRRTIQMVVDCADPHLLNRFWAELLGYEIEHHDANVREVIAAGYTTLDEAIEIDGELWWRTAAACRDPEGDGRVLFQVVPEAKVVKNRLHLDVRVGDDREAVIARCLELGATRLGDGRQGPHTWVTLADPEGNEFCVS